MKWYGDSIAKDVHSEMRKGLSQAAEMVLTKSKEVCPVYVGPRLVSSRTGKVYSPDPGMLQRSAAVSMDGDVAFLSYNTPYALRQHEELGYHHEQGQAKYLEKPFDENKDAAIRYVEKHIAAYLGGG